MEMYLVLLPALQQACFWLDRTLESPPFQDVGWPCYQPDAGLTSMIWRNDVSLRLYISTKNPTLLMFSRVKATKVVIPVPATVWLFGTGLIGLVGFSKRRKAA
jgi:hypothetical protein